MWCSRKCPPMRQVAVVGPNNFERVALLQPGGDEVSREQNMARFTNRALELLHESLEPHASNHHGKFSTSVATSVSLQVWHATPDLIHDVTPLADNCLYHSRTGEFVKAAWPVLQRYMLFAIRVISWEVFTRLTRSWFRWCPLLPGASD
eukprot:2677101-Amphidinium_carterae.2